MLKGYRCVAKFLGGRVRVWSYPVISAGQNRHSFEVHVDGVRARRFLHLDLGDEAEAMARVWADGAASMLAREARDTKRRARPAHRAMGVRS